MSDSPIKQFTDILARGAVSGDGLSTITPHDRLFHAVMSLRTEHGDAIDQHDAQELYEAIVALVERVRPTTSPGHALASALDQDLRT